MAGTIPKPPPIALLRQQMKRQAKLPQPVTLGARGPGAAERDWLRGFARYAMGDLSLDGDEAAFVDRIAAIAADPTKPLPRRRAGGASARSRSALSTHPTIRCACRRARASTGSG